MLLQSATVSPFTFNTLSRLALAFCNSNDGSFVLFKK